MKMMLAYQLLLIITCVSASGKMCKSKLTICQKVKHILDTVEKNGCHGGGRAEHAEASYLAGGSAQTRYGETVRQVKQFFPNIEFDKFQGCLRGNYSLNNLCKSDHPNCGNSDRFRTYDGTCNNVHNPLWGSVGTEQRRQMTPYFDDGNESPRIIGYSNKTLPNARVISNALFTEVENNTDSEFTMWVWALAQLADHDITLTPTIKGKNGKTIYCCKENLNGCADICLPVAIPKGDPHFRPSTQTCLNFVRSVSSPCCGKGCIRSPINDISVYLDANPNYGNNDKQAADFRENGGKGAKLRVADFKLEGTHLPRNVDQEGKCKDGSPTVPFCSVSGDIRHHVAPSLTAITTMFHREHNRIVDKLRGLNNPSWDDERVYQEARMIVMAEYQKLIINDLIAGIVLDDEIVDKYQLKQADGYDNVYNDTINAQVALSFSTAAFRFGHSLVNRNQGQYDKSNKNKVEEKELHLTFDKARMSETVHGVSGVLRYLGHTGMSKSDCHFTDELRNLLFHDQMTNLSKDLGALNIMRSRDHGLAPYNKWRELFELEPFPAGHEPDEAEKIRQVYGNSDDDIDIFVGGITEKKRDGALVGDLFANMIGEQFFRLKSGDRYYYQNQPDAKTQKGRFDTEAKVKSIQTVTLARLLCANTETAVVQPNVFRRVGPGNHMVPCSNTDAIPDIDFNLWKEY